ncbi:MAG: aldo/keto reductase [Planctomycetota bacterium]
MSESVAWGILGAGTIAKAFVNGTRNLPHCRVAAVGSRSVDKAKAFADEMELPGANCHGSYEALLADPDVDAVYIATPHPMHPEWAIKAAEAGKHILCEKPVGLNHSHAMAMIQAARENNVFFMDAFKDRCHPQAHKLVEILQSGVIGPVRMIRVSFGFNADYWGANPEGRLLNLELGGGGILDVGCYAVEYARLIAGAAVGKPFLNPTKVIASGHLGETGVDEWAAAHLEFETGAIAEVATAVRASLDNTCHIAGELGTISVPNPWLNSRDGAEQGKVIVTVKGEDTVHEIDSEHSAFGYEIKVATDAILAGKQQADSPAMTWDDTLGQMHTLDQWRQAIGLTYPQETPEGFPTPLSGRALTPKDGHNMQYSRVPGLDRDVSRFVMGCDNQTTFAHTAVMFDDWFERGGNTFDTAHLYGGGTPERLLAQWHTSRGVRDQINIIAKGIHTPNNNPESITPQLLESLDRLQTDHVEIYIMHRDNVDIPAGEFVDVLNEHAEAGRVKVFGGSNWSQERFIEANEYAKANGKQGFSLLSNNFSLARMVNPVWQGCIASSTDEFREFHTEHQIANFAWSSQARGYFLSKEATGKIARWDHDNAWDYPDNRQRRERAFELAEKYNVSAINIAAAYVLSQPFPSFALIGPRFLNETATSMPALDLTLTAEELAYLDLRD